MNLIFDAHLDLAWNACEWNRDLKLPVKEIRKFERQLEDGPMGDCTVSWPNLQKGRVGVVIATLLPRLKRRDSEMTFFQSREAAYASCNGQLSYYRALVEQGFINEISNVSELDTQVDLWLKDSDNDRPVGFILSMEGSNSILSPGQIHEWHEKGLKILGPAHYGPGPYCHGTGSEGGLSAEGRELLVEMQQVGMLLDVTHFSDESFWEALEIFDGPVLASHHNCRSLVPGDRQLTDEQIKALIERGAVIGASFDCWMIVPGWKKGVTDPNDISIEDIVNHTDYICQLAGNAKHCGIGSDLDGGFGKEQSPGDLETVSDLQKFASILENRGYPQEDIDGIMYGNFVNFFRRALGE